MIFTEFLNNANFIKAIVIDSIYKKKTDALIGSEIKFGSQENFADIIMLNDNKITGYEIKAANDDFRSVRRQIKNYSKVFDYFYLVVTDKHKKLALREIEDGLGLIIISNDEKLNVFKPAELVSKNYKEEILASMTKEFLIKHFNTSKNLDSKKTRLILKDREIAELKVAYYKYLTNRLKPINELFIKERGPKTHFEDIMILSFNINAEIL